MSTERHRRISSAIAVRWTPALAARVGRRIEHRLARRRQRRRVALIALALLGTTGFAYAFTRSWMRPHAAAKSASPAATSFAPPAMPAAPPVAPELAPAPATEPPATEPPAASASPPRPRPARHVASAERRAGPPETVAALFAAADAARLAGQPAEAVAPLTAIFTRHPGDPRAAVAAYQLGRVLAFDLHDRARAAAAFARAHDLDPNGPLAADAAAHAAEARAQGEKTK
jgi:TolA-binding protein